MAEEGTVYHPLQTKFVRSAPATLAQRLVAYQEYWRWRANTAQVVEH
jgi:hypothetical protein